MCFSHGKHITNWMLELDKSRKKKKKKGIRDGQLKSETEWNAEVLIRKDIWVSFQALDTMVDMTLVM